MTSLSRSTEIQYTEKFFVQGNLSIADTIWTSKKCPLERGFRYIEVYPKLVYFASKTLPRVLGYGKDDLK